MSTSIKINLPRSFRNEIIHEADANVTIRSSVSKEEDFDRWLNDYKEISRTNWITDGTFPNVSRFLFMKKLVCKLNGRNKGIDKAHRRSRNKDCKAFIKVIVSN